MLAGCSPCSTGVLGQRLPTSFLPEEDYGYFLLNVQLPPAASLERTDAVCRKVDAHPGEDRGRRNFNTIVGFSLLTRVTASNNAFFFVAARSRGTSATSAALQARADRQSAQRRSCATRCPRRWRSRSCRRRFPASAARAASRFWLQDRSGGSIEFLERQLQKFLAAARKRPELAGVTSPFTRRRAAGLRRRRSRQGAASRASPLGDVYQTLQAFLGGLYVNQFNRFGRQWRVFLQAEGEDRAQPGAASGSSTCATTTGTMVPLSALQSTTRDVRARSTPTASTSTARRRSPAPRRPATARARRWPRSRRSRARRCRARSATTGPTCRTRSSRPSGSARSTSSRCRCVFVFLILAALYESWSLPFSVLLTVPVAVFGAFLGLLLRELRPRRLRADRHRHADRPGREERDPDRRVRQGRARGGRRRWSRRRSRARGCGCGRS